MEQNRNFGKNTQFCDDVGGKENFLNLRRWRSHLLSSFIFKTLSLRNWECTQYLHMFSVRLSKQPVKEPWELILNVKCRNSCSFPSIYIKQKPGSLVERSTQTTGHLTGTKSQVASRLWWRKAESCLLSRGCPEKKADVTHFSLFLCTVSIFHRRNRTWILCWSWL